MCYFLYGAINKEINQADYERVASRYEYHFNIGTKHDVKMSVAERTPDYHITDGCCDCESPIGAHDPEHPELQALANLLTDLKTVREAKCVYLSKNWEGRRSKKEETVHIDDLDLPSFLAEIKEQCLYRIDLYPRY